MRKDGIQTRKRKPKKGGSGNDLTSNGKKDDGDGNVIYQIYDDAI